MRNELNSDVKLAAQIVLSLFVLIITLLLLALPRFRDVESVLKHIYDVIGTLDRVVVKLLRLIRNLHQIIPVVHEGFQQVVSILEFIHHVVGPLVDFIDLLLLLIRICRRIWTTRARQAVVVANDQQNEVPFANINYGQNDIPLADAEVDATNGQNNVIVNEELNI